MDYTKVQSDLISQRAEELQSAASNMQSLLDEVTGYINKIGNENVWSGTAAEEARRKFDSLIGKMPEFYESTKNCYNHLMSVAETYKQVDNSIING